MTTAIRRRNIIHGLVPTISQTLALLTVKHGKQPRILRAAVDNAVNVHFETLNKPSAAKLYDELIARGYAFVHEPPVQRATPTTFTILSTL